MVKSEAAESGRSGRNRDRDGAAAMRSNGVWSRAEYVRLLRAWLHVLKHQPCTMNISSAVVSDEVLSRTFTRFEQQTQREASSTVARPESSVRNKMEMLARVYRVIVNYNEQQGPHTPEHNPWLALSLKQQRHAYAMYHSKSNFVAVDAEMLDLLTAIDCERECAASAQASSSKKQSVLWTKDEEWVLINAWRQVAESRSNATMREHQHIVTLVYKRFVALSHAGTPRRTKGSVKAKLANLVTLYRLVTEFNVLNRERRTGSKSRPAGSHSSSSAEHSGGDGGGGSATDWFAASSAARAQHLIESSVNRVSRVAEFDRDMFHAMEHIMRHLDGFSGDGGGGAPGVRGCTIIDLLSDTEDDNSDETDWEMLPATPSIEAAIATRNNAVSFLYEPSSAVDADANGGIVAHTRKRAKLDAEQEQPTPSSSETQRFLTLLAKLKKERRADKVERRQERAERQELVALIAEERKLRRKDRKERRKDQKERQRERREWELERDRLKLKLKSMRTKLRLARRQLAAS